MNTVNHAAAGAIIGLSLHPAAAMPVALASHFVLDAMPHYGFPGHKGYGEALKHRLLTYTFLLFDVTGLVVLVFLLAGQPLFVFACAFTALLPDIFWVYRYFWFERKGLTPPGNKNKIVILHRFVQWCERPWGFVVEITFLTILLYWLGVVV